MIGADGSFHWFACRKCYRLSRPGRRAATHAAASFRCDDCGAEGLVTRAVGIVSSEIPKGARA